MNIEFDLTEGLTNPEKAKEVVKKIQKVVDELALAKEETLKAAKQANELTAEYEKQVIVLTKTVSDLAAAIKAVYSILGKKSDLFKDDAEMVVIMESLAHFVTGSGAIKLGAMDAAN